MIALGGGDVSCERGAPVIADQGTVCTQTVGTNPGCFPYGWKLPGFRLRREIWLDINHGCHVVQPGENLVYRSDHAEGARDAKLGPRNWLAVARSGS